MIEIFLAAIAFLIIEDQIDDWRSSKRDDK